MTTFAARITVWTNENAVYYESFNITPENAVATRTQIMRQKLAAYIHQGNTKGGFTFEEGTRLVFVPWLNVKEITIQEP